jgi:hypothetical protein
MEARLVILACVAGIIVLGACGSSGGNKKGNARIDTNPTLPQAGNGSQGSAKACALVTQTDAGDLFGNQAAQTPDVTGGSGARSTCVWKAETDPGSTTKDQKYLLQVRVYPNTNYYTGAKSQGGTSVKGVGDKAIVRSTPTTLTLTFVKKGQTVSIAYSILGFQGAPVQNPKSQQDSLVRIGKQAASRL